MTRRRIIFATGEFYHIFNKTVGNEQIFDKKRAFNRAISLVDYYRYKQSLSFSHYQQLSPEEQLNKVTTLLFPQVTIFAFAFMPNHFHFLVRQNEAGGIVSLLSNFQNGLAKYYNTIFEREGSLFKAQFKAVRIESEEELFHVSRYIHLNPVTSYLISLKQLEQHRYTSYTTYLNNYIYPFIDRSIIEDRFITREAYQEYVSNQAEYQQSLRNLQHLFIEK